MAELLEVVLARIDERTKHMKGVLDTHIADSKDIPGRVAKLETNVSWLKRIGIGVPAAIAAITATWKGIT